jgi:hypothetical protein
MRYIPNSPEERDEMLEIVGLSSAEELFRSIPSDVQLNRALNVTDPLAEPEVIGAMETLAAKKHGGNKTFVFRRGRLFALFADDCRSPDPALRIFYELYAVSAGNFAGNLAIHFRVSDSGLPADRNGRGERFDV